MSMPLRILALAALLAALGGAQGCKKAETVSVADVLGTWEIKSWSWNAPRYYSDCNMLGTLEFSPVSYEKWHGVRVDLTFKRSGAEQKLSGYADMNNLPIITFELFFGEGFPDNLAFRGIVEEGRMLGYGGLYWDLKHYDSWEWEAVKK